MPVLDHLDVKHSFACTYNLTVPSPLLDQDQLPLSSSLAYSALHKGLK